MFFAEDFIYGCFVEVKTTSVMDCFNHKIKSLRRKKQFQGALSCDVLWTFARYFIHFVCKLIENSEKCVRSGFTQRFATNHHSVEILTKCPT